MDLITFSGATFHFKFIHALTGLKPAFVQDGMLDYNFFGEQAFRGGVEFHSFDTKRLNQPGMGVQTSTLDTCWQIYLEPQKNRSIAAYRAMDDINGRYLIQRSDVANAAVAGDYHWVEFYFESARLPVPVYVFGQLSQWQLQPEFELTYNEARGAYMGTVLLKQGYYNYVFAHPALEEEFGANAPTDAVSTELTEGTHWQTRNDYTLILYNRGMGLRYDRIIAYLKPSSAL